MSSFHRNQSYEKAYTAKWRPGLFDLLAREKRFLLDNTKLVGAASTKAERNDPGLVEAQRNLGDFLICHGSGAGWEYTADLKIERTPSHNLFWETHSNYIAEDESKGRAGWAVTSNTNHIWYAFGPVPAVAILSMKRMRHWLHLTMTTEQRNRRFAWKAQKKHEQLNLTMGNLVPFRMIDESFWKAASCSTRRTCRSSAARGRTSWIC